MQLRFLGQSYSKPHNQLLPSKTNESKVLRPETMERRETSSRDHLSEKNYVALRPVQSFKADWGLRKYRGVDYVELRFLGQY